MFICEYVLLEIGQIVMMSFSSIKFIIWLYSWASSVDQSKGMLGTFAPQKEPYVYALKEDTTPSGALARGVYSAKLKVWGSKNTIPIGCFLHDHSMCELCLIYFIMNFLSGRQVYGLLICFVLDNCSNKVLSSIFNVMGILFKYVWSETCLNVVLTLEHYCPFFFYFLPLSLRIQFNVHVLMVF